MAPIPTKHIIMQGAAMHNCVMPDRNIIPNCCAAFNIGAMDTGAVLHIDFVSHSYKIHITSYNSIKPDTAVITHYYITNNGSIRRNEIIVSKLGEFTFYREYYRHSYFFKV
jgi:hypothetical protein